MLEKKMLDLLKELISDYGAVGVKVEFEAEGAMREDVMRLGEIVFRANTDLIVKIGGCEAIRDLNECKLLGANGVMAPMIETPYAMKKFLMAIDSVYKTDKNNTEFIINAETITCYNNFDNIMEENLEKMIKCVVVGRKDLLGSLGTNENNINSDRVFKLTEDILTKTRKHGLASSIGGGLSAFNKDSINFIRNARSFIDRYETRKIIFDLRKSEKNLVEGLIKSCEFERLYLMNRMQHYNGYVEVNHQRLSSLEESISKLGG